MTGSLMVPRHRGTGDDEREQHLRGQENRQPGRLHEQAGHGRRCQIGRNAGYAAGGDLQRTAEGEAADEQRCTDA